MAGMDEMPPQEQSRSRVLAFYAVTVFVSVLFHTIIPAIWFAFLQLHDPAWGPRSDPSFHFLADCEIKSLILCGPIPVATSTLLFWWIRSHCKRLSQIPLWTGRILGTFAGSLNCFGIQLWYSAEYDDFKAIPFKTVMLILPCLSGWLVGGFIAQQAWCSHRPNCRAIPQFSLRALIVFVLLSGILMFVVFGATPPDEEPLPIAVVVKVLDTPLPREEEKKNKFLWDNFANKPEEEVFSSYTVKKWKINFAIFSNALVKKAENQKLDSVSLRDALDLVLKDSKYELAYLPVGAYQTMLDEKPVWIIAVKWEHSSRGKALLGHIRMFVFEQKSIKQVGFVTCE
jgi:hypothetical protein